jgi:ferredoxin-type protein NapH
MREYLGKTVPFLCGIGLAAILGSKWWGFWIVFPWVGLGISIGWLVGMHSGKTDPDRGRRVAILFIMPVFIVFLGLLQRENLQLEEAVIYFTYFISAGIFTRVLIHYAIAKIFGPFIFGRGFCGWGRWMAALLEWLPIKENRAIPKAWTFIRFPVLLLSVLIPFLLVQGGYDYLQRHVLANQSVLIQTAKFEQFIWFLTGNGLYYLTAVALAFVFRKKRAFCKIACPVGLVMKLPASLAVIKRRPSGNQCTGCGACNRICPMDIDVMGYIRAGKRVSSTECILCNLCKKVCPAEAIN